MLKTRRDVATLRALSSVLSSTEAQAATSTREFRQSLVRDENYKRFVDALLSRVFIHMASIVGGSPKRTKKLLQAIAKVAPAPKA